METNETKTLENLKRLTALHFRTLKPANDKSKTYIAQIKFVNYFELGCVITEILKLCIVALDHDAHKTSTTIKHSPINVGLILEIVLEMFPMDEFEFLSDVAEMVGGK
ncbi:hypothetical protein OA93_00280 [Flavobacterium sp. KMS]|uniref:hypothetical protein n=1 Tax=Flavobacterium sp. KMS TaxID=1566023 RepID=UPI00057DDC31|nr:hypothetical protein [Flavobacterium sp. KMS]KIC00090.1 hypothetical protein OA93_00280 [Flavobacterium sp. KMS]